MANSRGDLFLCDFPLYTISNIGGGEFYVAGGGGKAKTGVPNAIELHSVYHDGDHYSSKCVLQHDMESDIIMNSEPHPKDDNIIAVGIGHSNSILKIHGKGDQPHRSDSSSMHVSTVSTVRTDFSEKESYQKIVRFNFDGSLLITGGSDGILRLWKYPDMQNRRELRGHSKEIEDITCHPNKNQLVSICRGGEALVWELNQCKQMKQFTWHPDKYRFKSCRYSPMMDGQEKFWLYFISVPIQWSKGSNKTCYLIKWCTTTWKVHRTKAMKNESACVMAINSDGLTIAVGTTEGDILVFNCDLKLQFKIPRIHSVFITGLTFLQPGVGQYKSASKNQPKEIILSISADRTCCLSELNKKGGSCGTKLLFIVFPLLIALICIFMLELVVI